MKAQVLGPDGVWASIGRLGREGRHRARRHLSLLCCQLEWAMKLWWPHSEAMIAFLMGYSDSGDPALLHLFYQVAEYTFRQVSVASGSTVLLGSARGRGKSRQLSLSGRPPSQAFLDCGKRLGRDGETDLTAPFPPP